MYKYLALAVALFASAIAHGDDSEQPSYNKNPLDLAASTTNSDLRKTSLELPASLFVKPKESRWEYGIGVATINLPTYRGSNVRTQYTLPIPYFSYQSPHFEIGRGGSRASFVSRPSWEIDLSLSGSLPVRTTDDDARKNMPALHPSLEVGPALVVRPWVSSDRLWETRLNLPVRWAWTVESKPRYIGLVVSPSFDLSRRAVNQVKDWNINMRLTALATDARNNAYFYQVDPAYATAERPAYKSKGGYAGWQASLSSNYRWRDFFFSVYFKQDNLSGAVFVDSPLVKQRVTYTVGAVVVYVFQKSALPVNTESD